MKTPTILSSDVEQFLETMKVRHYSSATRESYRASILAFCAFLAAQGISDLRAVDQDDLRRYVLWLQAKPYASWTVVLRIQAVRRFYEHLEEAGRVLLNPCSGLPPLKQVPRLPKTVLTINEAWAVLNAPNTATKVGLRDKAILEVFYSTGIRLEEMTHLHLQDVDCREGFLRVNNGKYGKDRIVPLGRTACGAVTAYVQQARSNWVQDHASESALWLASRKPHGPLKKQVIAVLVKHYAQQAGIGKPVTPHVWRHTCATHLVADGANMAYVQRLLGHQSLRTTQVYARTTVTEIKTTHAHTHPRNQDPLP